MVTGDTPHWKHDVVVRNTPDPVLASGERVAVLRAGHTTVQAVRGRRVALAHDRPLGLSVTHASPVVRRAAVD